MTNSKQVNEGQEIQAEAADLRKEESMFSHSHDAVCGESVEALAFQIAAQMTYVWPTDVPCDGDFIQDYARDVALTVHLNELARF